MNTSQLPDIRGLLVTADNPARTDLPGMDHARCAALHNYLVHYAWLAAGRTLEELHGSSNTYFTAYGAAAEALRPRLDPSLAAFLASALVPPVDAPHLAPFFFWASGLAEPAHLFDNQLADLFDLPEDSLVMLYYPGQGAESNAGLFYHQGSHRAAVFMHLDDWGFTRPECWSPLETVLSNWIDLVRLGKVAASPTDTPALFGSEKFGSWEWRPYGEAQAAACVAAWDRLCDAIEARVSVLLAASNTGGAIATNTITTSTTATATSAGAPQPLLAPAALDAALVPEGCFARAFLTRARRPRFRHIAPGLALPPADAAEFAAAQPFTRLRRKGPHTIPPVCLFPAARGSRKWVVDFARSSNLQWIRSWLGEVIDDDPPAPPRVPAGIYSEAVDRAWYDNAEEGFRLLLPYPLDGGFGEPGDSDTGARRSDGSFVERGSMADLFQHGYKPFGGDAHRPQRLERLLDHWRRLVDDDVWAVGPDGVEGTIDTFKEADTARWGDYRIPPTW